MANKQLVRGALLIALALVLQSIRLVIPMPATASTFIIGTLVHMMLVVVVTLSGRTVALLLSCLLPVTAYAQGQLLLPFLIPIVAVGNGLFVLIVDFFNRKNYPPEAFQRRAHLPLLLPPIAKAYLMGIAAYCALKVIALPNPAMVQMIMYAMSVPQFVTGVMGIFLASAILLKLKSV